MKRITLQKVADALEFYKTETVIDEKLRQDAEKPLQKMLELSK